MDLSSRTQGTFFISSRKRKRPSASPAKGQDELELNRQRDIAKRDAYEASWAACEQRIDRALAKLNKRTLKAVTRFVQSCHTEDEMPSPFPRIPTAVISGSSMATASTLLGSLFENVADSEDTPDHRRVLVDCRPNSNLDSLVRSIVLGLDPEPDASLPQTLPVLLSHLPPSPAPRLLIALHQTHLLPPPVLPQLIHVLSRYASEAKFTLALTSAAASDGREGLKGLESKAFDLPAGSEVWEAVVEAAWFPLGDLDSEAEEGASDPLAGWVGVDGDVLEELRVGFERVDGSLEALISAIQYIHLKTFLASPLGLLISPDLGASLLNATLHQSLLSLPSVAHHSSNEALLRDISSPRSNGPPPQEQVLALLPAAREQVASHWRGIVVGYHLFRCLKSFLAQRKGDELGRGLSARMMRDSVRGDRGVGKGGEDGWRWSVKLASKMTDEEGLSLAEHLGLVLERVEGDDEIVDALANVLADAATSMEGGAKMVATGLDTFFTAKFVTSEKILFHEVFYFHHLEDLIRVFRPSPLLAIQTALLSPHTYLGCTCCSPTSTTLPQSLPDTTILFLRYLESGKLINLYDWFESFASVLESGTGKGAVKGGREEVQARFMRAFHELDFLGLLKSTKRREDCCLKTLFRLAEQDDEDE